MELGIVYLTLLLMSTCVFPTLQPHKKKIQRFSEGFLNT